MWVANSDCVYAAQVTSAVVSFVMKLLRNAGSKHYLTQLQELGFLIHWESLLSTHGDEMGMLEDFIVAIHDLNQLKFKVSRVQWMQAAFLNQ